LFGDDLDFSVTVLTLSVYWVQKSSFGVNISFRKALSATMHRELSNPLELNHG